MAAKIPSFQKEPEMKTQLDLTSTVQLLLEPGPFARFLPTTQEHAHRCMQWKQSLRLVQPTDL